jgi:predicted dehydrogenase
MVAGESARDDERPFIWGIVGSGAIAAQFAADLAYAPPAKVGAICARTTASAERLAQLAPDAEIYTELVALLAEPRIDAIYIATPNTLHAEQALAAIIAGKPVLIEKPIATTMDDAQAIADAAARHGCFAMEGLWSRFLPSVAAMRGLLRNGTVGTVTGVRAELAYAHDERAGGRLFDPALGGGAALDLGVYPLSLAIYLLGLPTAVEGDWEAAASGVDRRSRFRLKFGEVPAELACGLDRLGHNSLTIFGTEGALRLEPPFLKAQRLTVFSRGSRDLPLLGAHASMPGLTGKVLSRLPIPGRRIETHAFPGGGLQFEALAVIAAIRAGAKESSAMPLAESVAVLKVIETVLGGPAQKSG